MRVGDPAENTAILEAAPVTVVIVEPVPVNVGVELVAVTVVDVAETVCTVKETVAIPAAFVVEVVVAKEPLALDLLQVTVLPAVLIALPLISVSWAEIVTDDPAAGEVLDEVTKYSFSAPAVTVSAFEVAAVKPLGVNLKVKAPAVPVITKLVKVATPATAAIVVVPLSVPVPDAIAATTFEVKPVIAFPLPSTTRTTGWVESAVVFAPPIG